MFYKSSDNNQLDFDLYPVLYGWLKDNYSNKLSMKFKPFLHNYIIIPNNSI